MRKYILTWESFIKENKSNLYNVEDPTLYGALIDCYGLSKELSDELLIILHEYKGDIISQNGEAVAKIFTITSKGYDPSKTVDEIRNFIHINETDFILDKNVTTLVAVSGDELVLNDGVVISVTDYNGPRHVSESPNNLEIDAYDKHGNHLFFIRGIGEKTLSNLTSKNNIEDNIGDLIINYTPNSMILSTIKNDKKEVLYIMSGEDKKNFITWFGEKLGYSYPDIDKMLGIDTQYELPA